MARTGSGEAGQGRVDPVWVASRPCPPPIAWGESTLNHRRTDAAESEGADTSIESGSETEPRSDEASTLRFGPAALDAGLIRRQA